MWRMVLDIDDCFVTEQNLAVNCTVILCINNQKISIVWYSIYLLNVMLLPLNTQMLWCFEPYAPPLLISWCMVHFCWQDHWEPLVCVGEPVESHPNGNRWRQRTTVAAPTGEIVASCQLRCGSFQHNVACAKWPAGLIAPFTRVILSPVSAVLFY